MIKMLAIALISVSLFPAKAFAGEVPELLAACLDEGKPVRAKMIAIVPPKEFEQFVQKLSEVAQKDPEWFVEHAKSTPAGSPLPLYDKKLGMSQEDYDYYAKLWDSREAKTRADTTLLLERSGDDEWKINGTGMAAPLSLLRYNEKTNSFKSPNGELQSIADIDAPKSSLLGAWKGKGWLFQSNTTLVQLKENVAIGASSDGKYSYIIYRVQEVAASGKPLFDQSMVIRFPAKKK